MSRKCVFLFITSVLVIFSIALAVNAGKPAEYVTETIEVASMTSQPEVLMSTPSEDGQPIQTTEELTSAVGTQESTLSATHQATERSSQLASRSGYVDRPEPTPEPQLNLSFAPHEPTGLSADQLDIAISKTSLAGLGEAFAAIEEDYNVNAVFAIAVAAHESGWGKHQANTNNLFGLKGSNGWMSFGSKAECINYFGRLIHNNYSTRYTLEAINQKYCGSETWPSKVKQIMQQVYNNYQK